MTEVKGLFDQLRAKREAITAQLAPLQERRDKLQKKMQPLEDEMRSLQNQIKSFQGDDLVALDKQISTLARAMGAAHLVAEGQK